MYALNQLSSIHRHGRWACLSLSGPSSTLQAQYFPPIELSPNKNYVLGLVELLSFKSIPNIDTGKNKFYVGN